MKFLDVKMRCIMFVGCGIHFLPRPVSWRARHGIQRILSNTNIILLLRFHFVQAYYFYKVDLRLLEWDFFCLFQ